MRRLSGWRRCGLALLAALVGLAPRALVAGDALRTEVFAGSHFGYGGGSLGNTNPLRSDGVFFPATVTGLLGGYQVGWNAHLRHRLMLGVVADASFIGPLDRRATGDVPFDTTFDALGTARLRLGFELGTVTPYLTGGLSWSRTRTAATDGGSPAALLHHSGSVLGLGADFPLAERWTGSVELLHFAQSAAGAELADGSRVIVDPRVDLVTLGFNYRLAGTGPSTLATGAFNIHGQSTFIEQVHPSFHAPYSGTNSLPGHAQGRETWTSTLFVGFRLGDLELYVDPELDQGFGLGSTLGVAGFPNGEAQKGGSQFPKFRLQRYVLRYTFDLGGGADAAEDGPNQLAGARTVDRLTLTAGRFAVGDYFDANVYAHDPRADFMNWALWEAAAYDFPADLPGFTRGLVAELNHRDRTLRAGVFQVPQEPNSDVLTFRTGGAAVELELRHLRHERAGKVRVGAFANRGDTGRYDDALASAGDVEQALVNGRSQRTKFGAYVNAEQALTRDLGAFARASFSDGRTEILSFTDADGSLSGGLSLKGRQWGRPDDAVGVSAAVNALSGPHRRFLAAGGLGLIIGDGQLRYREEKVFETFYACRLDRRLTLTFDYQFVADPAYNADRGPVSFLATRLHAEF